MVRLKIVQEIPIDTIDGIDLRRYQRGYIYEVGSTIGNLLFAEGWAQPVDDAAFIVPFSANDPLIPHVERPVRTTARRGIHRRVNEPLAVAADLNRLSRRRRR